MISQAHHSLHWTSWPDREENTLHSAPAGVSAGTQATSSAPSRWSEALGLRDPRGFSLPSGGPPSLLDHSPADALGGLPSSEEIAGRRTDLQGSKAAHQMHRGSWPAQIRTENRPVIHQFNRLLLMQLLQQRLLADALPMPRGEPDPICSKLLASGADNLPVIGPPACCLHLAVFMKLEFAASLGLPELCCGLWRDRTAVACLQNKAAAAVHAGFHMKALEVLGAQPAGIGIERLLFQATAAQQLHLGATSQRPET